MAETSFPDYVVTYGLPIGTAVVSLGVALVERRKRRKAENREQQREREIDDIRRRGGGPFLQPITLMTGQTPHTVSGEYKGPVPPTGKEFRLVVSNANGRAVRGVSFSLPEGWKITHGCLYGVLDVERTALIFNYPYELVKHGTPQLVQIDFETFDGIRTHQIYQVRHGFSEFVRIDPA